MSLFPRKCSGCFKRKSCDVPVGTNQWYCDECAVFYGTWGTNKRLKNVAEEQSRKWNSGPCPHQSYTNVPFRDPKTGRRGQKCICNNPKCGAEIYTVLL